MKKLLFLLTLLFGAAVIGYLFGTEAGREQRDQLMARLRRAEVELDVEEAALEAAASQTAGAGESAGTPTAGA